MAKEKEEGGPFERIGESVGGTVGGSLGKAVGRANDMAMNAAGSLIGQAMGVLGDWWTSADADRATRSFGEREERACRQHHETRAQERATRARDYETARPLYEFGYVASSNPEYQSRPFDRVEADLERAWESLGRDRYGAWPEVRDEVGFGYRVREGAD